jgi:hypothetical protein
MVVSLGIVMGLIQSPAPRCATQVRRSPRQKDEIKKCVSRESNAGPIDGNDGFYH